ncbi:glycosyltransferase family 2 protein [Gluconobacter cerinus]|uniref:glycosyltransferase family 2 protein n=1 Tax=Gluconobacter cerinus TaxID=38307 RepID=UPI003AB76EC9
MTDHSSDTLTYRDLEQAFFTFYKRNERLKNSLSWRVTLPIRRVRHYAASWRNSKARFELSILNIRAIWYSCHKKSLSAFWFQCRLRARRPKNIQLDYHRWQLVNPLPRLHDDNLVPSKLLVLLGPEALTSPQIDECYAGLNNQRGCEVTILPLSGKINPNYEEYDAIIWLRMAAILTPDYGQIACRELRMGKTAFYSDHDTHLSTVIHENPFFKPCFSPELLAHIDFLAAGCAISPAWFKQTKGWLVDGTDIEKLYTGLRSLSSDTVAHLPICLSHMPASVPKNLLPPRSEKKFSFYSNNIKNQRRITAVIPTTFKGGYFSELIHSLYNTTCNFHHLLDIIVVSCDEFSQDHEDLLQNIKLPYKILYHQHDFNYATVNNLASSQSESEILLFLNDDIEFHDSNWLPDMLTLLERANTGAVGALLLYPDNTIQHAGCLVGMNGGVGHIGVGLTKNTDAGHGVITAQREVSAVTGACMAIKKDVFFQAGKFDENLPLSFNDIALCLNLCEQGYTNYLTTRSHITHHESRSRGRDDTPYKYQSNRDYFLYARSTYPRLREVDPYYNLNLSLSQPYLNYTSAFKRDTMKIFTPPRTGCLILIAQRPDYDSTSQVLLDSLVQASAAGTIRVCISGNVENFFSRKCRNSLPRNTVHLISPENLKRELIEADEKSIILDLRLLPIMEEIPPFLELIGMEIKNNKVNIIDIFGRKISQRHISGKKITDILDVV